MQAALKRLLDIIISAMGLLIFSPFLLAIALVIRISSPGPALFIQERIGKNGKSFRMYKFRSMVMGSESRTLGKYIHRNEGNITPVGRFLRRWALDELPQLINVIRGEMSIVGPRPTLSYQVEKYNERQRKRLLMKPGLTGWAQVNGRNKLSWPERIELDVWYVENWSILLDMKIMLMTIPALLRKEFAFAEEDVSDDIVRVD
jgi:lipopolysaccharide/colanic/teichoic acid biosynthesis glycosyltransferase